MQSFAVELSDRARLKVFEALVRRETAAVIADNLARQAQSIRATEDQRMQDILATVLSNSEHTLPENWQVRLDGTTLAIIATDEQGRPLLPQPGANDSDGLSGASNGVAHAHAQDEVLT